MSQPVWFVKLLQKFFPHRFLLSKLTHLPLVNRLTDWLLFEGDDIFYLPQDHVIPINQSVDGAGEMVLPSQVVEHFIDLSRLELLALPIANLVLSERVPVGA